MAVTNFSPLLGLALPTTGDLSGTWGTTVNDAITSLIDSAIAGTTTLSADADVTLSTTDGSANQARNAVILWTASNGATTRNITAPAQSKAYVVINSGTGSVVIRGAGPTTGVTVPASARALVAWNGTDFVKVASNPAVLTTDVTGTLPVANGGTGTTSTTFANLTTNVTGTLPVANGGTGITSFGAGVATFLGTPSSANLASAVTDETGSGALVFATNPTLVTPILGTPQSGTLTNATGLPIVAGTTGTLSVARGGTGTTTLTANNVLLGNGTSALQVVAPGTSGNVLTSNGTTWTSAAGGGAAAAATPSALGTVFGVTASATVPTFLGYQAGLNNTGNQTTAVGYQALASSNSGQFNTAFGWTALNANTSGSSNVALGPQTLKVNTSGVDNVAVGNSALTANTTGGSNVAVGQQALQTATTGGSNTAVGYYALYSVTTSSNVAVGRQALQGATTGSENTAVGAYALANTTTGSNNTALGSNAGLNLTTGSNNSTIGYNAAASSANVSNQITLGNSSVTTLRCQVTTITSLSDARDKANVADLSAGLGFVNALRPVKFDWNMRDGGKVGVPDTGFIAQDLQAVQITTGVEIPGLVYAENPDQLEAGYGKLLPVMVKAIQELSAKVDALQAELNQLKGN